MRTIPFTRISPLLLNCEQFHEGLAAEGAALDETKLKNNSDCTVDFDIAVFQETNFNFTAFVNEWDRQACESQRV